MNDRVPAIIPRVLLNNIAIKLSTNELVFEIPRHQNWALDIFGSLRSDLVQDFLTKLKITNFITP